MITVPETAKDVRLDHFLVSHDTTRSRSQWQKEIKAGRVLLDGKQVTVHHFLKGGEVLTFSKAKKEIIAKAPPLTVIAEEPTYLVIAKPAGLLVHPTEGSHEPTLVDSLLAYDPKLKSVGESVRPGIVHRLDKLVSGLMVIARTQAMYDHLKSQFATRAVEKEYTALVDGSLSSEIGEINFPIGRSKNAGRMAARPVDGEGQEALTKYEVVERFPTATLVRVFPKTGRTHQIRAHFHALGHPIVGDPLYITPTLRARQQNNMERNKPTRIMLHATALSFDDLDGKECSFELPPPKEFTDFVKSLR